jgi:glycosyltransferase involved in cell wall biosynthesis
VNILIFPEYPYPTNHVVVETVYERLLPERGHVVHMIRPAADVTAIEVRSAPWSSGSLRLFPFEPLGSALSNVPRRFRQLRWLRALLQQLEAVPLDVVLVRNDLMCAREALAFCRRRGIPLVYQVSSPDPEFRIRFGRRAGFHKGLYSIIRGSLDLWVRRRVCRQADVVLPISDAMRTYMIEDEKIDSARAFSFPMGFNDAPPPGNDAVSAMRAQLGLPAGKTIVYTGVLDQVRDPEFMLDVLERVQQIIPEAVLLVLTHQTDDRRVLFEQQASARRLAVKMVGPLPHAEVSLYLRCADVMMSPCPPIFEYRISSPTKSLEALGAGLPVVGNEEVEEHVRVLRESGGGIAAPYDVAAFAEAIVSLLSSPEQRCRMGKRGREWALTHRTYDHLTEYLEAILSNAQSREALARLPHSNEAVGERAEDARLSEGAS